VAARAGSRIALATGGAGERGSRFCRAQQKSARSCALLTRGKIGGTAMSSTRPAPPRYDGKSEERKRGVRGAPGRAANPARIAPGGRCPGAAQPPLRRMGRDQMREWVSPPSSSKRLA
jgi:hypothetical protein